MAILRKSLNLDFVKMANQLGVVNDPIVAFTRASTATRINPTTGAVDSIAAGIPCLTAACNLAAGVASAGSTFLPGLIIAGASGGRAADVANVDVTKIWNVAATIVCQVDFGAVSGVNQTAIDGTADAGIYVYRAADGSIKISIRSGGATIAQATVAGQYTRANVAVCVEGNTCRYAVNGAVATMAISTVPAATVIRIGAAYNGAEPLNGTVQSVAYMPYALDAYTLRAITTTTGGSEALPVSPSVFNFLGVVATQAAMLSLAGKKGDWCIRSDTSSNWIITGTDPTSITSWAQITYPASPVTSVDGRTGAVVLTKSDVGFGSVDPAWFDQAVKSTSSPTFSGLNYGTVSLVGNQIFEKGTNGNASIALNYAGYAGGFTQYRDIEVYDGKGNIVLKTTGSTRLTTLAASLFMSGGSGTFISWANDGSSHFLKYDSSLNGLIMNGWAGLKFQTNGVDRLTILAGGNVGIGNPAAPKPLSVMGNYPQALFGGVDSGGTNGLFISGCSTATTYNWGIGCQWNVDGAFEITPSTAVGGTSFTTPVFIAFASGIIRFNRYSAGTLVTDANGNISASSDETLKDIDSPFIRGMAALRPISPILYHWNETSGLDREAQYAGFGARNVRATIPEAVFENKEGILSLQDRPILAACVNALKELDARISALEAA